MAISWLSIPQSQNALGTSSGPAEHFFLPAAFGLGMVVLDEGRKWGVRRWPRGGWRGVLGRCIDLEVLEHSLAWVGRLISYHFAFCSLTIKTSNHKINWVHDHIIHSYAMYAYKHNFSIVIPHPSLHAILQPSRHPKEYVCHESRILLPNHESQTAGYQAPNKIRIQKNSSRKQDARLSHANTCKARKAQTIKKFLIPGSMIMSRPGWDQIRNRNRKRMIHDIEPGKSETLP
ncbi:hypothetical protein EYC84_012063 [Monilinia fructicola]|uniref:Uncharacterized protein n=1 Tax=Monilinia fructicola TaxID=38448 RepID=A0A5M9J4D9_MONFR|nr:hypothetical protein EYC84_012063 [Monilinia fructicola]